MLTTTHLDYFKSTLGALEGFYNVPRVSGEVETEVAATVSSRHGSSNIGPSTIRIGFWGPLWGPIYNNCNKEPLN